MTAEPADQAPYAVILSPGARRSLTESLPSAAAFAAWEFISGPLARRPRVVGVPLRAPFDGLWRARRGEYRVRYRIDEPNHRVIVLDVDHRRDAYQS
ncbi:MAG: type II toxin-antitoxin system RelE/ParE family toxin [Actinomycetota bacterium]|nr:type II toxin-antitoxin system RelE/ParE family toxin [Actinomycetota bacterium]